MVSILPLVLVSLLGAPAPADVCDLMSGAGPSPAVPGFGDVRELALRGDYKAALDALGARAQALSEQAEKLFFNGEDRDQPDARRFIDTNVLNKGPLRIRNDNFTLSLEMFAWAAFLACKSGRTQDGLGYLNSAWRDWMEPASRDDAALLLLAASKPEDARQFLADRPDGDGQKTAAAVYQCVAGVAADGAAVLKEVSGRSKDSRLQAALTRVAAGCTLAPPVPTKKPR
jgi:hypothetical protein